MLDNLSQPVAFTTAPIGTESGFSGKRGLQRDGSSGSETEREGQFVSKFSRNPGHNGKPKSSMLVFGICDLTHLIRTEQNAVLEETDEEVSVDEGRSYYELLDLLSTNPVLLGNR